MSVVEDPHRAVRRWLYALWAMVLLMVVIGGVTRLTGSGLSIVEWRPVTGAIPPLNDAAWQAAFDEYKRSPQFQQVNHWMALADFKRIYFWEYLHRLFGRLIGFATLLPWLAFVVTRKLRGPLLWRTASVFVLGGLQGALGWYMVKSGLLDAPRVSHLRLAMHLLLGMGVGQWILWLALDLRVPAAATPSPEPSPAPAQRAASFGFLALLVLQIMYGAFMAGTHAGYLYSSFPDMNGAYLPGALWTDGGRAAQLFVNPAIIHYVHRVLGLCVLGYALVLAFKLRAHSQLASRTRALAIVAVLQVLLGVSAVVLHMPLVIAALHQLGAYVLCSVAVALCHGSAHASESRDRDGGLAGARQDLRRA
ncbi:MAG TPA: COX15/CtaA family protein [Polyangiales bacterium]|nr:COX15/CtaA family protein [Polyangiales bacterium]